MTVCLRNRYICICIKMYIIIMKNAVLLIRQHNSGKNTCIIFSLLSLYTKYEVLYFNGSYSDPHFLRGWIRICNGMAICSQYIFSASLLPLLQPTNLRHKCLHPKTVDQLHIKQSLNSWRHYCPFKFVFFIMLKKVSNTGMQLH